MRADRRAEGACHRLASAWWSLILAGLVVLSAPFVATFLQRATSPPLAPSSPYRVPATNPAFLRSVIGPFTENRGQVRDGDVRYTYAAGGLRVGMVPSGLLIGILDERAGTSAASSNSPANSAPEDGGDATVTGASVVRIGFDGSNRVAPRGREELPIRSNYFSGGDPSNWRVGITSYREIVYEDLYDGIDLMYRPDGTGLKYEFVVRPGADPDRIRWSYEGVAGLEITAGALVVRTDFGEFEDAAPIAFQGEREVRCSYSIEGRSVGFRCGSWDPAQALTIDPLLYSTFLGGSTDARGLSLAVDASGDAYITGYTLSADFPTTPGAYRTSIAGAGTWDAFVVKLNPSGTAPVYSTFLGGSNNDRGFAIAVDGAGDAYVAGYTNSSDFPTTPGALRTSFASGGMEGFVTKLSPAGNALLYSTFLGGTTDDRIYAIALGANGDVFVTGRTKSPDFPVTAGAFDPAFQNTICGPVLCGHGFVSKLDANGSTMVYSSYLGGRSSDRGLGIAVDASGDAYVAGYTNSSDFPVTPGAYGTAFHAGACGTFTCSEGFVAKVNAAGSALAYSTFLGGSKTDLAHEVAIDPGGTAYVTGETNSTDFPVTPGAYESTYAGAGFRHAFVAKLDATGSTLVYSTFLGGGNTDQGHGITVDASGNAYVVGRTNSSDFPITPGAVDTTFGGGATNDVFVSELGAAGTQLLYSTFLGGGADDWGNAITLDAAANVYVTGHTRSSNFPTTPGAFRTAYSGFAETFVAKLSAVLAPAVKITSPSSGAVANTSATVTGTSSRATLVQVRVGSAVWTNATGVASWTVTFDLSPFPNGPVVFEARALNGTVESAHDSITIQKAPAGLALDRCTVRPDVAAIQVGGTQAFAASGWNGTTEIAGVSAAWSVTGNIGNITPGGVFSATTTGTGSVLASVTYSGRSATCSASVAVTAGPPPTVTISSPSSGSNVTTDLIVVRGTSAHADAVQVRAGTGSWSAVAGSLGGWSAQLDLSVVANMQAVAIEARAFNGSAESTHDQIYVVKVLPLVVLISYPAERAQVSGTFTVTGTTTTGSTVQIRFDGGLWDNASTTGSTWSYRIDTTTTFDGDHLIEARAVWGSAVSPVVARKVVVSNSMPPWLALPPPLLCGLAVAIPLAGLVLALLLARKRRRRRAAGHTSSPQNLERR